MRNNRRKRTVGGSVTKHHPLRQQPGIDERPVVIQSRNEPRCIRATAFRGSLSEAGWTGRPCKCRQAQKRRSKDLREAVGMATRGSSVPIRSNHGCLRTLPGSSIRLVLSWCCGSVPSPSPRRYFVVSVPSRPSNPESISSTPLSTVGKGRIFGVDPIRFIPDWRRMGVRHPIPNGSRLPSLRYVSSLEVDDPTPKNRAGERSMNRRGSSVS